MSQTRKVAVLVGSLRKESFTRKIAHAAMALAPANLELRVVELGALPLYDPDLERAAPEAWRRFRDELRGMEAVLFATPEYNRSVPACMKNAVDVGSRPSETSALAGKPAAVISVSPGLLGAFGANHHLRQSLVFLGMPTLPREVYLSKVGELLDEHGALKLDATRDFLRGAMHAFADWIEKTAPAQSA